MRIRESVRFDCVVSVKRIAVRCVVLLSERRASSFLHSVLRKIDYCLSKEVDRLQGARRRGSEES